MARIAIALVVALTFCSSLVADGERDEAAAAADKAEVLRAEGKPLEGIKLLDAALAKDPDNFAALFARADCYFAVGEDRKAIVEYEHLLKLKPSGVRKMVVYNNLSYILAASSNDDVRDGKRAVDFAETAQLLEETPTADVLDTLAAAYAEAGQFDRAIEAENKAIKLAAENEREEMRKFLKMYEDHKPRRDPPAKKEGEKNKGKGGEGKGE